MTRAERDALSKLETSSLVAVVIVEFALLIRIISSFFPTYVSVLLHFADVCGRNTFTPFGKETRLNAATFSTALSYILDGDHDVRLSTK